MPIGRAKSFGLGVLMIAVLFVPWQILNVLLTGVIRTVGTALGFDFFAVMQGPLVATTSLAS
jgi:hypothetical protein